VPTIVETKTKYQKLHDKLTKAFYKKKRSTGVTAEEQKEFDTKHAQIWQDMDEVIKTASNYVEPVPPRDLEAEVDELKRKVQELEKEG
jgi:polyhydroxyalkanoate synthesis regulator phasin